MDINVIKKGLNEMRMEMVGEDHTFCNSLHSVLLEDDRVEISGYYVPHPLISNPIFYIRTKKDYDPMDVLSDAVLKMSRRYKEIERVFREAIRKFNVAH